jgi:DNA-binding NarL/FixJ family response regulator
MEVFTMAKSVLIAEDHTLVRQAICSLFDARQDFEVCGDAENGKEAVEMAQVLHPDLIVLDLEMPVMNGLEAAHALKRSVPETPILVFSEYSDLLSEHEAHAQGISALVSKGEPVSVLLDKARAALDSTADRFL